MKRFILDKLVERAICAARLKASGEEVPMRWFANSPCFNHLWLAKKDTYRPPYLRPAPLAVITAQIPRQLEVPRQLEMFA
jgi:hypothetical protein